MRAYDPGCSEGLDPTQGVVWCTDEYDSASGADALVLATEWNQFRGLDFDRLKEALSQPVLVDLRNVYEPERMRAKGFRYTGVGR